MSTKIKEKANSFDRILRQRSANYLKNAEKHSLRLMELAYDKKAAMLLKRIDKLKNGITQIKNDIEYGSFLSLPAFRSGRRFHTEAPTRAEEEISQLLFIGELILLESRNLFERLQDVERKIYGEDETQILEAFTKAEESLRRIEHLHLSHSSSEGFSLDAIIAGYEENVNELEDLAEKENLSLLEKSQLSEVISMNKGSILFRFISKISRKPVFEKEITDVILLLSERLRTKTGGLVKLPALYSMVKSAKPTLKISLNDVESVVRILEKKGIIPGLREVSGMKIVELVPVTATPDQNIILELASANGRLSLEGLLMKTKWTNERAIRALKQLEELGVAKYEITSREWVFPAFVKDFKLEEEK
ncbi:MAG: hypothetical protein QXU46_02110 [Candidatus Bathyarchaeia archaeon]